MIKFPKETKDQKELRDFYGEPGEVDLKKIYLPFPMVLSWDETKTINSFYCHEKVADSLLEILSSMLAVYGYEKICELGLNRWGGCYNPRPKRGNKDDWSTHAYAISIDMGPDADRKKFRWKADQVESSKPEYDDYWRIVEANGWKSLGRTQGDDWMHIQATS